MAAGYHPIEIIQGTTFELPVTYRDSKRVAYDIAAFGVHFVLKAALSDTAALLSVATPADFTVDPDEVLAGTVTKDSGSRSLVGVGTFFESLSPGDTIAVPGGSGVELRLVDSIQTESSLMVREPFRSTASGQVAQRIPGSFTVVVPDTATSALAVRLVYYEVRLINATVSPVRRTRLLWGPALVRGAVDS